MRPETPRIMFAVMAAAWTLFGGLAPACADAPAPSAAPGCIMVVMGTVTDRESFKRYQAALPALYDKFGGAYLGIARNPEVLEGKAGFESVVLGQWPSCEAARAFWWSPEYRALVDMRKDWGSFDVILVPELARRGAEPAQAASR